MRVVTLAQAIVGLQGRPQVVGLAQARGAAAGRASPPPPNQPPCCHALPSRVTSSSLGTQGGSPKAAPPHKEGVPGLPLGPPEGGRGADTTKEAKREHGTPSEGPGGDAHRWDEQRATQTVM